MQIETKKLLEEFASQIHWGVLGHQEDLERFWDFIIFAHKNKDKKIALDEFMKIIEKNSSEKTKDQRFLRKHLNYATYLYNKYEDGLKILEKYDKSLNRQEDI